MLGSDGIFDKLQNEEIVTCVWNSCNLPGSLPKTNEAKAANDIHQ